LLDIDVPVDRRTEPGGAKLATLTLLKDQARAGNSGVENTASLRPGRDWTPTANNMSAGRYWHTATLLGDGMVLVAGTASSLAEGRTAELYDPASNRWLGTGAMSAQRFEYSATLLPCGEVLVVGGFDNSLGILRSAERYNPKTRTWRPTGSLTAARYEHTATLLPDGRVLVTGGWGPDSSRARNSTTPPPRRGPRRRAT
jgi:hypothetical protein